MQLSLCRKVIRQENVHVYIRIVGDRNVTIQSVNYRFFIVRYSYHSYLLSENSSTGKLFPISQTRNNSYIFPGNRRAIGWHVAERTVYSIWYHRVYKDQGYLARVIDTRAKRILKTNTNICIKRFLPVPRSNCFLATFLPRRLSLYSAW